MRWFVLSLAVILSGCSLFELLPEPPAPPVRPQPPAPPEPSPPAIPPAVPPAPPAPPTPPAPPVTEPTPPVVVTPPDPGKPQPVAMPWLKRGDWSDLPGWRADEVSQAWGAFLQTCRGLRFNPSWIGVCQIAAKLPQQPENWQVRSFFEQRFQPWQISQAEGGQEGLVTGYYEPLLRGSRTQSAKYSFPLRSPPEDLLVVDLSTVYPELKNLRLRGRLQGNKVVPYFTRSEIEAGAAPLPGRELVWVDDPVELFFLQVQGSGRVQFENGEVMRVGYADQNGQPYRSIGRYLVEQGELKLEQASMQGIKAWGAANPGKLDALLAQNPSYVFFRELPKAEGVQGTAKAGAMTTGGPVATSGPVGALGVALTPERSIAVDPRYIPLGAPVFLATTWPGSAQPLARLMLAQDSGGAVRGAVRADYFWGFGEAAGAQAGRMRQSARMWVLLPRDYPLPK